MNKIFLMILCLISWPLQALETNVAPPLSVQPLARIPVQQDGRIKPLEQFARVTLRQLSGSETLDHIDAMPWLMEVLFTPEFASQRPLFLVNNDDLRRALALPDRASHRFSAQELESPMGEQRAQVMPIVMMAPKERSTQQQALMDLYQRYALFIDLQQSFSIVLPLNAPRPESYALPDPLDYLDLQRIRERLLTRAQTLAVQSKGQLKALSSQEQDEVALAMLVEKLEQRALQSQSLRVMPAHWQAAGGEWFAPWALIREGFGSPSSASYLVLWKAAALAYRTGDVAAWNHAASVLADAAAAQLQGWQGVRVQVEYLYVIMAPLNTALALSAAALVMLMLSRRVSLFTAERVQTVLRFALLVLGMALLVRIFILARPPVGTLYESLLFVAWVVLAACTVPKSARQAMLGLGALSTSLLLLLAPVFATDETMGMLSAVLNTDFWLTIHVLCITSGYAACLVVGGLAHAEMLRASRTNMPV
ncbi:MAG: hypothetical protein K2Q12_03850, partial [Rickettsiales bacterium]|nr:hypothetical protein [Rickettsiales bacterium]